MNFVSIAFFVFFVVVLGLQLVLRKSWMRQAALLIASYVFYGWWDWRFCFLMLGLTAVAFFTALGLEKRPGDKRILAAGVIAPLAVLFFFKYMNFFVDSFCAAFGISAPGALNIILPVGISFYTFQSLSYTIDAWRGKVAISHDFIKFALYISFFPQLVAGPIVKAADFLPQLDEDRRPTGAGIADGLNIFFWGMLKKAVLADQLSPFVDAVFAAPNAYSSVSVILAVLAYAMQIYFDFSGYSDMAIGCANTIWRRTSTCPTYRKMYRNSGSGGTSRCRVGCSSICTYRWAATARAGRARISILCSPCCWAAYGTVRA